MISSQLALTLLVAFVSSAQELKPLSASTIFQRESRYIATIRTYDNLGNAIGQGSGIVIAANPEAILIATNLHVLRGACDVSVDIPGEEPLKSIWGIGGIDSDNDVVAIAVRGGKTRRSGKWGEWNNKDLRVGDPVYAIGNPMGLELTISEGIVSGIRKTLQGTRIQITAPISPGSSGGGLYDRYGRLVGITSFSVEGGQNLNFAVPIEALIGRFETGSRGTDWHEVKESFCKPAHPTPTLDELDSAEITGILGTRLLEPATQALLKKLNGGEVPRPRFRGGNLNSGDLAVFIFYDVGIKVDFSDGRAWEVSFHSEPQGDIQPFRGALPFGLLWRMPRSKVVERLGRPHRTTEIKASKLTASLKEKFWDEYESGGLRYSLWYDGNALLVQISAHPMDWTQ